MTAVGDDVGSDSDREARPAAADEAGAAGPWSDPQLADLVAELALLRQATERYQERAAARERVVDQLSAEVDRLRLGDRRGLLRPVLVELCRLRDDLLRQAGSVPETFSVAQTRDLLRSFADTVELELEAHGVVPFSAEPGSPFDPRRHRRLSTVPTELEADHGTVAAIERSGYTDLETEKVLQPAVVLLHAFHPPAPPPAGPAPATNGPATTAPAARPADPTGHPTDQHEEQQ